MAEGKKGGKTRWRGGEDCLDGTSKRRKRESEGNEIILRHKEDEEKNHLRWLTLEKFELRTKPFNQVKTVVCKNRESNFHPHRDGITFSNILQEYITRIPRTFNRIKALSHFAKTNEKEKKRRERKKRRNKPTWRFTSPFSANYKIKGAKRTACAAWMKPLIYRGTVASRLQTLETETRR